MWRSTSKTCCWPSKIERTLKSGQINSTKHFWTDPTRQLTIFTILFKSSCHTAMRNVESLQIYLKYKIKDLAPYRQKSWPKLIYAANWNRCRWTTSRLENAAFWRKNKSTKVANNSTKEFSSTFDPGSKKSSTKKATSGRICCVKTVHGRSPSAKQKLIYYSINPNHLGSSHLSNKNIFESVRDSVPQNFRRKQGGKPSLDKWGMIVFHRFQNLYSIGSEKNNNSYRHWF